MMQKFGVNEYFGVYYCTEYNSQFFSYYVFSGQKVPSDLKSNAQLAVWQTEKMNQAQIETIWKLLDTEQKGYLALN